MRSLSQSGPRFPAATLAVAGGLAAMLASGCANSATPHPFGAAGPSPSHATPAAPSQAAPAVVIPAVPPPPSLSDVSGPIRKDVLDVGGRELVYVTADDSGASTEPTVSYAPAAPADNVTITVEPGQTLFAIAREHLGSGARWRELVDANPGLDPLTLRAGQKIRIPR